MKWNPIDDDDEKKDFAWKIYLLLETWIFPSFQIVLHSILAEISESFVVVVVCRILIDLRR